MSRITQLTAAEIEARFHITGQRPVQFLLAGLAEHGEQFTVHFNHGNEHFLTLLLAAPPASGKLIFDCSGSPEINRRVQASGQLIFNGHPGGIQVQFTCGQPLETLYAGARAFAVALPPCVLRLQRRESFRIETPHLKPVEFFGRLPGGHLLKLAAHDLSCAGLGLTASTVPEALAPGMSISNSRFVLPDDKHDFLIDTVVRHITEHATRNGRQWRIGLQFSKPTPADENRIQRYIARIEHERHALS